MHLSVKNMTLSRYRKYCTGLLWMAVVSLVVLCIWTSFVPISRQIRVDVGLNNVQERPSAAKKNERALIVSNMAATEDEAMESAPRDVTWQEPWPEVEGPNLAPEETPPSVHYVWCGADRLFTFQHYLGLLSALRILRPLRLLFHFTHNTPVLDPFIYNDWFQELKDTVPFLELRPLHENFTCRSKKMLNLVSQLLFSEGGVFVDENVILVRPPSLPINRTLWAAIARDRDDVIPAVMVVRKTFRDVMVNISDDLLHYDTECLSVEDFNRRGGPDPKKQCVTLTPGVKLYPRDIWDAATPFAELSRWLFYGKRAPRVVKCDVTTGKLIPRVTHYVRLQSTQYPMYTEELSFAHFLSIVSALHVAGLQRVYLHVTHPLSGRWWLELQGENVTVVPLQPPPSVFQQAVGWIKHRSDLARYNVVYKYGGAYQDFDTVWTSFVPDSLLSCPTVISPAISQNGLWPGGLSVGLFLARSRAPSYVTS